MDIVKAEQLALETWYMAIIMKKLTREISEECCLNETYILDLFAEHLLKTSENAYYEFIKE